MATTKQKQKDDQHNKLSRPPKLETVKPKSESKDRIARERAILQKEREDYSHSGIPKGSDPRE